MYLIWPLMASLIYVFGALWLKRAGQYGADTWLIAQVSNTLSSLIFIAIGLALNDATGGGVWWQALVTGAGFVGGQTLAFAAFKYGDVSVATPVLGLKILLVALLTMLMIGDRGSLGLWLGAVLATLGIAALSKTDKTMQPSNVWLTLLLSFLGAAGYASFDVCLQKWAPQWGVQNFLLWSFIWVAILSQGFFFMRKKNAPPLAHGWKYLSYGAMAIALQSLIIATVIGYKGNATAINVVYSLRGMWSVAVVWLLGSMFDNSEAHVGAKIFRYRCLGAFLMTIGVILVFI